MANKELKEKIRKETESIVIKNYFAASGEDPEKAKKTCNCNKCNCRIPDPAAIAAGVAGYALGDWLGPSK